MRAITLRTQLGLVAATYAAVLASACALVVMRYLLYVRHPEEAAAAGGMYAGGDVILGLMIACLLLVPTLFLVIVIRNDESLSTGYAKVLFGLSWTAPICVGVFSIPAVNQSNMPLGEICTYRVVASPVLLVAMAGSRWLSRFARAKRLISYALLVEFLTLATVVALVLLPARAR
jgi:hypothetical protein